MNNLQSIILTLFLFTLSSCQGKIDIDKEKEAIIAVIEEETNAFNARDFDRLAETYIQNESTHWLGASKQEYWFNSGWDEIGTIFKEYFENNPEPGSSSYKKSNYRIKVYNESAWSISDQEVHSSGGEVIWKGLEVRFLEKADGNWKIVYLFYIDTSSYDLEIEENPIETETELPE